MELSNKLHLIDVSEQILTEKCVIYFDQVVVWVSKWQGKGAADVLCQRRCTWNILILNGSHHKWNPVKKEISS